MIVVPGQRPRTVAIAPQAGTEAPIGVIKKDSTNADKTRPAGFIELVKKNDLSS